MTEVCIDIPYLFYNADCKFCKDTALLMKRISSITIVSNSDNDWFYSHNLNIRRLRVALKKDVHAIYFCRRGNRYTTRKVYSGGGALAVALSRIKGFGFIKTMYDNSKIIESIFNLTYKITKKIKVVYNNL